MEPITFSGWMALSGLILAGLGWVGGMSFQRGRVSQSSDEHHGQIGDIKGELLDKERRVDQLGERVAKVEATVEHVKEGISRADRAVDRLAERIERLAQGD